MRKKINLLSILILFAIACAYSQEENLQETAFADVSADVIDEDTYTYYSVKPFSGKDFQHWSVSIGLGLNQPLADMTPDYDHVLKNIAKHWSLGGSVEYIVNPSFNFGLGYFYSITSMSDNKGSFVSKMHHVYPYFGINMLNYALFNRNRRWEFWISLGAGSMHMNSTLNHTYNPSLTLYTPQGELITEDIWNDPDRRIGVEQTKKWNPFIPVGLELSYNITPQVAVALKYNHIFYSNDYLEGGVKLRDHGDDRYQRRNYSYAGSANDQLQNVMLSLRWDITKKGEKHMRKADWGEYKEYKQEKKSNNKPTEPARIDTVVVVNQMAPDVSMKCPEPTVSIYFDFDKYSFTKEALLVISQIAEKMLQDESLLLEIRGYTDIDGSDEYNDVLSQRRADATKEELVSKWGISADRISANGKGKMRVPDRSYHHISRRCEFIFRY